MGEEIGAGPRRAMNLQPRIPGGVDKVIEDGRPPTLPRF